VLKIGPAERILSISSCLAFGQTQGLSEVLDDHFSLFLQLLGRINSYVSYSEVSVQYTNITLLVKSINQSTNQPTNQPTNQSINPPINEWRCVDI